METICDRNDDRQTVCFNVDYTGLPSDNSEEKLVINGRVYRDYDWSIVSGDEE